MTEAILTKFFLIDVMLSFHPVVKTAGMCLSVCLVGSCIGVVANFLLSPIAFERATYKGESQLRN